jgi:hypothetical protein
MYERARLNLRLCVPVVVAYSSSEAPSFIRFFDIAHSATNKRAYKLLMLHGMFDKKGRLTFLERYVLFPDLRSTGFQRKNDKALRSTKFVHG